MESTVQRFTSVSDFEKRLAVLAVNLLGFWSHLAGNNLK